MKNLDMAMIVSILAKPLAKFKVAKLHFTTMEKHGYILDSSVILEWD
jgi:hypothetical protein